MNAEEIGLTFVRLGLSIDKHFPGYIDSYYGPDEIARAINDKPVASLIDLKALADELARAVAGAPFLQPARREYLLGEIAAILTTLWPRSCELSHRCRATLIR